jgi:rare lipoprotein A
MGRSRTWMLWGVMLAAGLSLAACATPRAPASMGVYKVGKPYQVGGVWYTPRVQPDYDEVGLASWYGQAHQGNPTANGERFDARAISAAHTTLPLPSLVEVTNLENGRRLVVRVNDRGPFVAGRIIDLSQAAARELGFEGRGVVRVRVRHVGPGTTRTVGRGASIEGLF